MPDCLHVSRAGLSMPTADRLIWEYAKEHHFVIVTFDEDFERLSNLYGFPPKVVVLRLGNTSTQTIFEALVLKIADIEQFYLSDTYGLLEIY